MSSGPYVYEKLPQLLDQDRSLSHAQGSQTELQARSAKFCR